ncbi:MAG: XVIPCD domain-containing protein [Lysobacteraceae bacterium]
MAAVPDDVLKKIAETKLDKILTDFETANDTKTQTPGKNLRALLDQSPDLKERIVDSVAKGHLEKFELLPKGENAGGSYSPDDKAISLPVDELNKAGKNKASAAELVFVMGHEIQHSFNSTVADKGYSDFTTSVDKMAKGPGPHDYTAAVKTFIQVNRDDEAGAHIGGFNAISSQVLNDNPKAGLKELYNAHPGRMEDFIDRGGKAPAFTYALKPGLTMEADMTLRDSPENVKAMGKYYFDQPPSSAGLGAKGNQDYPNYYGEWAVNVINDAEKQALADARKLDPKAVAPEVQLNLKEIGLDKALMDTGLKYTDTTPKKPISEAPSPEPALYRQAEEALKKVDGLGLQGEELRNVVAATALQAQKSGMERIDGALLGKNGQVFAYQGDPASESADRVAVNVAQAKQQPADQSLATMMVPDAQQAPAQQQSARSIGM